MTITTQAGWTIRYEADDDTGEMFWWVFNPEGEEVENCGTEREAVGLKAYYEAYDAFDDSDIAIAAQARAEQAYDAAGSEQAQEARGDEAADLIKRITGGLDGLSLDTLKALAAKLGV